MTFQIGDRVRVTADRCCLLEGDEGVVIEINTTARNVYIELDEDARREADAHWLGVRSLELSRPLEHAPEEDI